MPLLPEGGYSYISAPVQTTLCLTYNNTELVNQFAGTKFLYWKPYTWLAIMVYKSAGLTKKAVIIYVENAADVVNAGRCCVSIVPL